MMSFLSGFFVGALSWWLAGVISGRFEPYDSASGLLINQLLLCGISSWTAFRAGVWPLFLCVLGAWLGMNLYGYVFGDSEARAWALLGAVTSILLLALPLIAGLITGLLRYLLRTKNSPP